MRGLNTCNVITGFVLWISVALLIPPDLGAQTMREGQPDYWLEEIVVVGDRSEYLLRTSTTATSVLTRSHLQQLPARNLADALGFVPGITFVDQDGGGAVPVAIVRGFFGGGEAEYILLTVDGIPINDLRTGLIDWRHIPISFVERIEVLRGGGSALYGDASLGAVVNVVTRRPANLSTLSSSLSMGHQQGGGLALAHQFQMGNQRLGLKALVNRDTGFRDGAGQRDLFVGGHYDRDLGAEKTLRIEVQGQHVDKDQPGPLTPGAIAVDREQRNVLFARDNQQRSRVETTVGLVNTPLGFGRFSLHFGGRSLGQETTQTLLLSPDFGNTQFHDENSLGAWLRGKYEGPVRPIKLVGGMDIDYGRYESRYFQDETRQQALGEGRGNRLKLGLYLEAQRAVGARTKITGGMRYDLIVDRARTLLGAKRITGLMSGHRV